MTQHTVNMTTAPVSIIYCSLNKGKNRVNKNNHHDRDRYILNPKVKFYTKRKFGRRVNEVFTDNFDAVNPSEGNGTDTSCDDKSVRGCYHFPEVFNFFKVDARYGGAHGYNG